MTSTSKPTPKDAFGKNVEKEETESPALEQVSLPEPDKDETFIRRLNGDVVTTSEYEKDPD